MNKRCPTIIIILILHSFETLSQCSETINTATPTINTWDWRTQYWSMDVSTNVGIYTSFISPFYNSDNGNLSGLATLAIKDYEPEDGWELLKRELGDPNDAHPPITNAYVVFYNKFTSKIRVFFLVTQTFSNTGTSAIDNAYIKIFFDDGYQSNLLTTESVPLLPLDQFKDNIRMAQPNVFMNQVPYWMMAEFPVAYDPCTCNKAGSLRMVLYLFESQKIEFLLNSQPYQKPVNNSQVNTNADWKTTFTTLTTGKVEGGLKATRTSGEAIGKLLDAADKQISDSIKTKLTNEIEPLQAFVDQVGAWSDMLPMAGSVVKSVVSLYDFLVTGGKSTGASSGPSQVMIMNNFKGNGQITSEVPKNEITLALPHSNQSGVEPLAKPVYNNNLGIFNLLRTPKIIFWKGPKEEGEWLDIGGCVYEHPVGYRDFSKRKLYKQATFQLQEDLKFVINPAIGIDLNNSSIKAAFIIENCDSLKQHNMQVDIQKYDSVKKTSTNIWRTAYHPIEVLGQVKPKVKMKGMTRSYLRSCHPSPPMVPVVADSGSFECENPKVFLKLIAQLKRTGSTKPSEDIIFIGTYPVTVTQDTLTIDAQNVEDIPEDINLPSIHPAFGQTVKAINTLSYGSLAPLPLLSIPISLDSRAGEAVILKTGANITPDYTIMVGKEQIYASTTNTLASMKASASEIYSFCNNTQLYNTQARNFRMAVPEQVEVLRKEEVFGAYPNPATNEVTFRYYVDAPSDINISLTDVSGKLIDKPVDNEFHEEGFYERTYNSSNVKSGLYFYVIETNGKKIVKRLVVQN